MEVFRLVGTLMIDTDKALRGLNNVDSRAGSLQKSLKSVSDLAKKIFVTGAFVGAAGLVAALVKGIDAAKNFETAMVELAKVTDPETAKEMAKVIREMAQDMPVAHEALAGIAADAGRLGVEGVDNLTKFTETVAQISVATDETAESAATNFARILKAVGDGVDTVDKLGSALNELSNNMATTTSEIVDAMQRDANALSSIDFSTPEIVALNAALVEVSESAERAGTALRVVVQKLKDPAQMEQLAKALGMTVDEFRSLRDENPMELFERLSKTLAEGGEKAEELTGILGESASRLAALGTNWDSLEEAISLANAQYEHATSLQKEYNTAADTYAAKMEVLKNVWHDIMIDVGEALIPTLDKLREWMKDHGEDVRETLTGIAEGVANIFEYILDHEEGIARALKVIGAGIAGLGLAVLLSNLNPITAALTGLGIAFAAVLVYWDDIVAFFKALGNSIANWGRGAWNTILGWIGLGKEAVNKFSEGIEENKDVVKKAMQSVMTPEEARKWGGYIADQFSLGFRTGLKTNQGSIAGGTVSSVPDHNSIAGPAPGNLLMPPAKKGILEAWKDVWDSILKQTKDFWSEMGSMAYDGLKDLFTNIGHGLFAIQEEQREHEKKMNDIHKDALDRLKDAEEARDQDLETLEANLAEGLITEQEYSDQREIILNDYLNTKEQIHEEEQKLLDDEKEAFEEQRKSLREILGQALKDMLSALKEQLMLKAAAALAEAIALTVALNPMAGLKYAESAAYGAGAAGLAITGFGEGALFDRPTLLPPSIVGEAGKEAFLPLNEDVYREIGAGIADASGINVDMRGLYDGAVINVRSDQDISRLAQETHDLWKSRMRGLGRKV